jgi:hypothetical protein
MSSDRTAGIAWPLDYTCARCGGTVWHPIWRRRGTRPYHVSCDPGERGGQCRYCGQPKTCRRHHAYREDCTDCGWQFAHDCDELALLNPEGATHHD